MRLFFLNHQDGMAVLPPPPFLYVVFIFLYYGCDRLSLCSVQALEDTVSFFWSGGGAGWLCDVAC